MQREGFNRNNLEQENRRSELFDASVLHFEQEYQKIYRQEEARVTVFAGDYLFGDPKEIILASKPEIITVPAIELFSIFAVLIKDDIVGKSYTQRITKVPEGKTDTLIKFLRGEKKERNWSLEVIQTNFSLRPGKNIDVVLTIDQYLLPSVKKDIPIAEIWNIRSYNNGSQPIVQQT